MAAMWWTTTIGMIICLGILGGVFIHFLGLGLNPEDSHYIDSVPTEEPKGDHEEDHTEKSQEL